MGRRYRNHSEEFRKQAVNMVLKDNVMKAEVARSLDIPPSLLDDWVNSFKATGNLSKLPKGRKVGAEDEKDRRIRQLEAENKILLQEREILKKAAAFFAKDSI